MKTGFKTIFIFSRILFGLMILFFDARGQQVDNSEKYREAEMHSFAGFHSRNFLSSGNKNYNIVYACCRWNIDPAVNYIDGSVTYYFSSGENNFDTLILDLADPMNVDSVLYNQSGISFLHQNNQLDIYLPVPLSINSLDSVKIFYRGAPVPTGLGSFVQTNHSGTPAIYTLSEPFSANDWWPCKLDLNDKIDSIDIIVTTPVQYKTASNGLLISEDSTVNQRTCHWKSNYPIASYLVAIGVTNYTVFSEQLVLSNGDTLPVLNYVYPEDLQLTQQVVSEIGAIIHLYDSLTIPYPFSKEKYGHAEFGWGGGMEHQTMSFIGSFGSELIAHECAHQWFGDKVTCGSWSDIWLHEGFATYFSGLVVEYLHPADWTGWKSSSLSFAVSKPGGSIYCDDTASVSRIFDGVLSYRKASCFLHMLRWKLGDADFFNGLKTYLNDSSVAYNYARTYDLKYHLEQESGKNLTQFFNEWFYGSGYPTYRIEWEQKNNLVDLTVFQSTSDPSVSFFHVPIPIELKSEDHDTMVVADPLFSGEVFSFSPGFKVEQVIFDPDIWILSKNNVVIDKSGALEDQLEVYPNPGKNIFTIYSKKPELFASSVKVIDQLGRVAFSVSYSDNVSRRRIDLSVLSAGVYYLRIETGSGVVAEKIVLEK